MKKFVNFKAVLKALAIVAAVAIVVSGVTYAALQSQQNVLTGNTIETATVNLQISSDNVNYTNSSLGFDFNNIIPGGVAVPTAGYPFYLKNAGAAGLVLKLAIVSTPTNPNNVDLSKVNVLLTTVGSGNSPQSFTLQSLMSNGGQTLTGTLAAGITQQYKLQVSMASDAVTGSSASLGNIDFTFSGTAQSN